MFTELGKSTYDIYRIDFRAGRCGIIMQLFHGLREMVAQPYCFDPKIPATDLTGVCLEPRGIYGLRSNSISMGGNAPGFDPTLDEEQLKAAFEWFKWNYIGRGRYLYLIRTLDVASLGEAKQVLQFPERNIVFSPFKLGANPIGWPEPEEVFPADWMKYWEKAKEIPTPPGEIEYGLELPTEEPFRIINSLVEGVLGDKNSNIEELIKEATQRLNATVYNYKEENDVEKLKAFYTALAEFYKDNYPDFYASKEFKRQWETVKIW